MVFVSPVSRPGLPPPPALGTNCQAEIDECEDRPCQNGGTCLDHVADYSCLCVDGFQGPDCDLNIDECASGPCLNQGRCLDGVNRWDTRPIRNVLLSSHVLLSSQVVPVIS